MSFTSILLTILSASTLFNGASSAIVVDLNCTTYTAGAFAWTPAAVACEDAIATASCQALYTETEADAGWPTAGGAEARPFFCYATEADAAAPMVQDMKTASIANCPKTCGYCCQTDAYNCPNVQFPRLNCNTITRTQCNSVAWRTIIAEDCPSACGFCGQGGCVDAVTNCANDLSICNTVGMQDFVNNYCQKTCQRCPSTTAASGTVTSTGASSGTCTSYIADTTTQCTAWAANGFCTNTFYTAAQRRARCATTCRIC
ncbi:hypothetical protein L5515_006567 [Caenorhabditis briggsae]|uniref:ShKT domain-containing protein n=1 Tax=Caenorhabditis briggsae TaxID=6238 RepID=A0AAE9EW98_CAEBR|nr:hypothetical protein L5515_006566 [Caenorhabditis briggsae]UMM32911.1 hypothetical protein L5515_006567 [Caenorhabditis briggsae]